MFVLYIGSLFTEPVIFLNEILPGPVREKRGRLLPFFVAAYLGDTRDTRNTARSKLEPPQHPQNCRPFTGCSRVGKWLVRADRGGIGEGCSFLLLFETWRFGIYVYFLDENSWDRILEEIGNDIQRKTRRLKSSKGIRRERRGEGGEDREGITSIDRRV